MCVCWRGGDAVIAGGMLTAPVCIDSACKLQETHGAQPAWDGRFFWWPAGQSMFISCHRNSRQSLTIFDGAWPHGNRSQVDAHTCTPSQRPGNNSVFCPLVVDGWAAPWVECTAPFKELTHSPPPPHSLAPAHNLQQAGWTDSEAAPTTAATCCTVAAS